MTFYGGLSAEHLRQFVERIERLEQEKTTIAEDIREVMKEAKSNGFDVKTLRKIVSLRKMDQNDMDEQEYLLDTYKRALGMLPQLDDEEQEVSTTNSQEVTPEPAPDVASAA